MQTFFNAPQLTDDEIERMKRLGRDVCTQVAYAARRADTGNVAVRWRSLGVENKVELFAGDDPLPEQEKFLSYMCGVTSVHATIDQVADLFNADHMSQTHGVTPSAEFTRQFNQDLASYQTLKYLRQRTEKYPRHSVSIKWFLMESPSMAAKPRDYVYLESQEDIMDAKRNKRGWVCAMHSIDLPSAPSLERTHDIVRGSLYRSGFVFTETETPGVLEAIYLLQIDFKGSLPMHLRQSIMKQRLGCLRAIDDHFLRRASAPVPHAMPSYPANSSNNNSNNALHKGGVALLGDIHLKSKHGVSTCACCAGGFGFLKKKHNCRVCGEVVCSSCCTQQRPSVPVEGIKKYHICSLCAVENRQANGAHGRSRSGHELYNNHNNNNSNSNNGVNPNARSALSSSNNMKSPNSGPPGPFPSRLQQPNLPRATMSKPMHTDAFLDDDPYAMRLRMPDHMVRKPSYRETGSGPLNRPSGFAPRYEHDPPPPPNGFHRHSTYFPPARPDSRESFVNERESVLDLYDEVGTSVSRYVPPPPARVPRPGPRQTQVQYLPRSGEATTIDLRDLNNASDVLAQLNNQRPGANESTVRLEIIQGAEDGHLNDEYDYDASLARRPRDYYPPSASGRFRAPPQAPPRWIDRPSSNPRGFDPMQMRFDNIIASTSNLVAPPPPASVPEPTSGNALALPAGSVYKGSRYRIKETRYYATRPDATPDEYIADERDSIVVDMPSQPPSNPAASNNNRLGNGSSPTAVAVSKFLDQDIDMFLQPMDKKATTLQLENQPATELQKEGPPNFDHSASIEDMLGPLRTSNNEDDSVAYLTALLMERLRMANASEREQIKETLRAAVQDPQ
ncbi:hypothetical protein SPRG_08199 [Saprolegnia parasitica CBS 223.65]|uniref:FYVE-type domain-containing protein n=1 Tax=Saprolegnia parasitica (strain CBS 223.65) TaxID=695850 RepID=A0A067CIM5_SAPPC|nr:hypothetical protein SPRG_08199 [Saprolegnia parasitica CBS 223.65]KDO26396.1 hypothetical protein SPRG_08199 [Saprolegnia parasitica CBS 223.65]|eukprot:XP_012202834.1 hypothetical protein SPRG_08199 [Saprolegnia parasitica CBS 223.65]